MKTVQSELSRIVKQYNLTEVFGWERERKIPCPEGCTAKKHKRHCLCEKGIYTMRGDWTNASRVWLGSVEGKTIAVTLYPGVFGTSEFFNVIISTAEPPTSFSIEAQEEVWKHRVASAGTSSWNGEQAGSAIPRHPETLRGFMYRTYFPEDSHRLPEDIVQYLLKVSE